MKYLGWLRDRFDDKLPVEDRMWFILASYNAGYGHVFDARRLAAEMGWNDSRWFGNVSNAMLLLQKPKYAKRARYGYVRGEEPVAYVDQIHRRYKGYLAVMDD